MNVKCAAIHAAMNFATRSAARVSLRVACTASSTIRCSALFALLLLNVDALAADTRTYDISAGSLSGALIAFALQSDRQLLYAPETVSGIAVPSLQGELPVESALDRLLKGTGIAARRINDRTFYLERQSPAAAHSRTAQASMAASQTAPVSSSSELGTMVVTGSRIRGVAPIGSDMVVLGRNDIDVSSSATVVDLLRDVPQVINLGNDATHRGGQGGSANTRFASGINLRGIGPNATLLLVDGNRMPLSGNLVHFVDPNVIATLALERMEVVADGASAVYGSDAIAGVVNMILRSDFRGAEGSIRSGSASDYSKSQIGFIYGAGWDSGNVMLAYENSYNSNLWAGDRRWYTADHRDRSGGDYRSNQCNPGTLVVNGVKYALPPGQDGTNLDPRTLIPNTENLCDADRKKDLIPRSDRHSFVAKGRQQLTSRLELNTVGFYSERDFRIYDWLNVGSLVVPIANPYFISPLPSATSVTVNYLLPEGFDLSDQYGKSDSYLGVADVTADLGARWAMTVKGSYGQSNDIIKSGNRLIPGALTTALERTDPGTAFNPFGDGTAIDPQLLDSLTGTQVYDVAHRLITGSLDANGPILNVPAGEIAGAVGYEHREERYGVDQWALTGSTSSEAYDRTVDSVYAEVFIPLASGAPWVRTLDASVALRYDRYNDFGSTTNPKLGLHWSPTDSLMFRASYGESFRAPSLAEINAPLLLTQRQLADPQSPTGRSEGLSVAGGNEDLDPEEAQTGSIGLEWQPEALAGLRLNLNHFAIEYRGQILDLYAVPTRVADPAYSQFVTRNPTPAQIQAQIQAALAAGWQPTGVINPSLVTFIVDGRRQNLGATNVGGWDFQVGYDWTTDVGRFRVGLNGSYYTKYTSAASSIAPARSVINTIDYPQRLYASGRIGWEYNGLSSTGLVSHSSSYGNNLVANPHTVSPWTKVDWMLGYDLSFLGLDGFVGDHLLSGTTVALNIDNLFDKQPPYVDRSGGFDPQVSSAIGRMISLTLRKRWH